MKIFHNCTDATKKCDIHTYGQTDQGWRILELLYATKNTYWVKLESETLEVTNSDDDQGVIFLPGEPEDVGESEPASASTTTTTYGLLTLVLSMLLVR